MADDKLDEIKKEGVDFSRRAFVKKALLTGLTVVGTAAVTKKVVDAVPRQDVKAAYLSDEVQQDRVMKDKQYVLMTQEEKDHMVQMFVSDYSKQA